MIRAEGCSDTEINSAHQERVSYTIQPQRNATLPPTHSANSAEWMGHSFLKLLGRINNQVAKRCALRRGRCVGCCAMA
jgi:hypothetical protein